MNFKKNVKNNLINRNEIIAIIEEPSNPGFEKSKQILSTELKTSPENIAVRSVRGKFGSNEFTIEAHVYNSVEELVKWEPRPKKKEAK
jgi:ribosomal protein S24E